MLNFQQIVLCIIVSVVLSAACYGWMMERAKRPAIVFDLRITQFEDGSVFFEGCIPAAACQWNKGKE